MLQKENHQLSIANKWRATLGRLGPNLTLLRVLPSQSFQAIGPFVFFEHLGPIQGLHESVPPHPHAGIEVLTYLLDGLNEHRDSLGNRDRITSGGVQCITAGRGILHAERASAINGSSFEGLQIWSRLPKAVEGCQPRYRAVAADSIPKFVRRGTSVRLIAGDLHPLIPLLGPILLAQTSLLVHLVVGPGDAITVPLRSDLEVGIYIISGSVQIDKDFLELSKAEVVILRSLRHLTLTNNKEEKAEVFLMGGIPAERPLFFRGSFVYGSERDAEAAAERFSSGQMGSLEP